MDKIKEKFWINERIEKDDTYWWLGPLGVIFVVLLIFFAILKNSGPIRLDDLGDRAKAKVRRIITGKARAIWLGMQVSPITRDVTREFGISPKQRGVVITDLNEGQGANAGINLGDVIVAINGKKITDFESFLWLAKQSKFSDGILLDIITNGRRRYVSMPFLFKGGPLAGPNANHWQIGGPINAPAFSYGRLVAFPDNTNLNQQQVAGAGSWPGAGPYFMICPNCGHSSPATAAGPVICPNCGIQMLRNQ
ncbi:MAG: PDZ domain-containing protein [Candidatus Omnitrophota bacterium]